MAEGGGFEPPIEKIPITDFESAAFDHSATLPKEQENCIRFLLENQGNYPFKYATNFSNARAR